MDTPLRITFDQPPVLGKTGRIEACDAKDGKVVESIDLAASEHVDRYGDLGGYLLHYLPVEIDGKTALIRLRTKKLSYGQSYFVRITEGAFENFPGSTAPEWWTFTVKAAGEKYPSKLTVAADGTGDFCTIQGAIDQIPPHRAETAEIFIRNGVYREMIRVIREKTHVKLKGEDRKLTLISYANNDRTNPGWIQRSVLGVEGDDFSIENLTVHNTTPYRGSQSEALYINAERCTVRHADFYSFQDTVNVSGRVYVDDCYIEGDVDFIWGFGTVVLENCTVHAVHDGYYMQSRNNPGQSGYVFLNCKLTAAPEVKKVWLARIETDRFPGSHVAFLNCALNEKVPAAGWQVTGTQTERLRFEEYQSTDASGKPLEVSQRLPASKQLTAEEAAPLLDATKVLAGSDGWNPKAGE